MHSTPVNREDSESKDLRRYSVDLVSSAFPEKVEICRCCLINGPKRRRGTDNK